MFTCNGCPKAYMTIRNLRKHQTASEDCEVTTPLKCPNCDNYFRSKFYMDAHQRRQHPLEFLKTVPNVAMDVLNNRKQYLLTGPEVGQVFPETPQEQQEYRWYLSPKIEDDEEQLGVLEEVNDVSLYVIEQSQSQREIAPPATTTPTISFTPTFDLLTEPASENMENVEMSELMQKTSQCYIDELKIRDYNETGIFRTFVVHNLKKEIIDIALFLERITNVFTIFMKKVLRNCENMTFNSELHVELVDICGDDLSIRKQVYATEYFRMSSRDDLPIIWQTQKELLKLQFLSESSARSAICEIQCLEVNIGI